MDVFEKIEAWRKKGVVIEVSPVNQIANGYEDMVQDGDMPLVTFSCRAFDEHIYDIIFDINEDTFQDALFYVLDKLEKNEAEALRHVAHARKEMAKE